MDLSWCIMCDKRIMDHESLSMTDSLYCSQECRLNDQTNTSKPADVSPTVDAFFKPVARKSLKRTMLTNYPWTPCYNKRRHNHHYIQTKRCSAPAAQSTAVAGSAAVTSAVGGGILSLIH